MKLTNNQQTTSFKSNTIVHFPKQPLTFYMEGLASIFTEMEGKIASGNVGKPFILDDGKSVLVPDISTSLGRMLVSAYTTARKNLETVLKNARTLASETLKDPQFREIRSLIELDKSTTRIDYKG